MTLGNNKKISHQFFIMGNHPVYNFPVSALILLIIQEQGLYHSNLYISEFSRPLDTSVETKEMFTMLSKIKL